MRKSLQCDVASKVRAGVQKGLLRIGLAEAQQKTRRELALDGTLSTGFSKDLCPPYALPSPSVWGSISQTSELSFITERLRVWRNTTSRLDVQVEMVFMQNVLCFEHVRHAQEVADYRLVQERIISAVLKRKITSRTKLNAVNNRRFQDAIEEAQQVVLLKSQTKPSVSVSKVVHKSSYRGLRQEVRKQMQLYFNLLDRKSKCFFLAGLA
eukprot:g57511.t1